VPRLTIGASKHCIFHPQFWTFGGYISQVLDFFLWFAWSFYKSAKFQHSTSSRSGLAFLDKHTKEDSIPHFVHPRGQIFWVSNCALWFGRSLYESAKFKLSSSSRSGLDFLDNCREKIPLPISDPGPKFCGFRFFPLVWVVPL
jgi:hypothetical protein